MSNPRPNARPRSIVLNNGPQARVYRTFEDWEADQKLDTRSPDERGIKVGSSVMWRHRTNGIIATDRGTVMAIADNTLTIEVKDVEVRTCEVHLCEIVNNTPDDRMQARDAGRRSVPGGR